MSPGSGAQKPRPRGAATLRRDHGLQVAGIFFAKRKKQKHREQSCTGQQCLTLKPSERVSFEIRFVGKNKTEQSNNIKHHLSDSNCAQSLGFVGFQGF